MPVVISTIWFKIMEFGITDMFVVGYITSLNLLISAPSTGLILFQLTRLSDVIRLSTNLEHFMKPNTLRKSLSLLYFFFVR